MVGKVKVKKLKKIRIRKVRARRQATVRKPPVTNVNIHFAGGSQHAGSVYIPNAQEHQVVLSSVPHFQPVIPIKESEPIQQLPVPPLTALSPVRTPTQETPIHNLFNTGDSVPQTQNPLVAERRNFIDTERAPAREQRRLDREFRAQTPVPLARVRGQGLSTLNMQQIHDTARQYSIPLVDATTGKKRNMTQLKSLIKTQMNK